MGIDDFLDLLACPVCRGPLDFEPLEAGHGWLSCTGCVSVTPVLSGMVLFTESRYGGAQRPDIAAVATDLLGDAGAYANYIDGKRERGLVDAYAVFEPFNESMRCAPPIIRAAGESMAPGEAILDLGNRSGWSGPMLAGLLPRQRVLSVCWGTGAGLGYRGFRHGFTGANRIANMCLVFSPITAALPVRDAAFALVHCYDSLHRQQSPMLFENTLRATQPAAALIHAHVHLADAEPEPYFERGGILRKASDYRDFLSQRLLADSRTAMVCKEAALFAGVDAGELHWDAVQAAPGYNACIVVAPEGVFARARQHDLLQPDPSPDDRMLVNPFLRINPLTGVVHIDTAALGGRAAEMLQRHPPFADALWARLPMQVDAASIALLRIAESGVTVADAARALDVAVDAMLERVGLLARQAVLLAVPCARSYHAVHRFHHNQRPVLDPDLARVLAQWAEAEPDAAGGTLFGDEVTRREALLVVAALADFLRSIAIGRGDSVTVSATSADALWPVAACLVVGARPDAGAGVAARLAVVDQPLGRWARELCVSDAEAPITLAKVLSAHLDDSRSPMSGHGAQEVAGSAQHWMDGIGVDVRDRLCLRSASP